jgi:hypothetical protein
VDPDSLQLPNITAVLLRTDQFSRIKFRLQESVARGCIQKFPDWPPGARAANGTALCHYMQVHRYFVSQSSSFAAIIFCVSSQRVFTVVSVYFFNDSVRKPLDTPSCDETRLFLLLAIVYIIQIIINIKLFYRPKIYYLSTDSVYV